MSGGAGPIEAATWPARLSANVVTPGASARVHGYSVEEDLAKHYRFTDLVYLSVTGSLPSDAQSAAFEALVMFVAPVSIAEAPAHAASLVRLCGGTTSAIVGAAAIGLGEQTRSALEDHASLFAWLEGAEPAMPARFVASDEAERESVVRLDAELRRRGCPLPEGAACLTRTAALLVGLHGVGIRKIEQLAQVLSVAKLPVALAEAFAVKAGDFTSYPMRLPDFRFEGGGA